MYTFLSGILLSLLLQNNFGNNQDRQSLTLLAGSIYSQTIGTYHMYYLYLLYIHYIYFDDASTSSYRGQ